MCLAYIIFGTLGLLFSGVGLAIIIASVMDWNYNRKNRVWNELKRTDYERRRPAAK